MKKANIAVSGAFVTALMSGCSGIGGTVKMAQGPDDRASDREKYCHEVASEGKPMKIVKNSGWGAAAGALFGYVHDKRGGEGVLASPVGAAAIGAAVAGTYSANNEGKKYNKEFNDCMARGYPSQQNNGYNRGKSRQWNNSYPKGSQYPAYEQ